MVNNFKIARKASITFILIGLLSLGCSSDDPPPITLILTGDVFLNTQTAVDNFANQGYTGVIGDVRIGTSSGELTDITNMNLIGLKSIQGVLEISKTNLTTLSGLSSLEELNGSIFITDNPMLTNLTGLERLMVLDGLSIKRNGDLQDFDQISNITEISSIDISENENLTRIDGLENVSEVKGNIRINGNPSLRNLNGLQSLTRVNGLLSITATNLESLVGLESLTHLSWGIIQSNSLLTSLSGLQNLTSLSIELSFVDNIFLTDFCDIETLLESAELAGNINIRDNQFNPTTQEILDGDCSN